MAKYRRSLSRNMEHPACISVAGVQGIAPDSRGEPDYIKPGNLSLDSNGSYIDLRLGGFETRRDREIDNKIQACSTGYL